MVESIKLISLNIEEGKHLDIQTNFFKSELPNIICLQEIFESDFLNLKKRLNMNGCFSSTWIKKVKDENGNNVLRSMGIAILSTFLIKSCEILKYSKDEILIDSLTENKCLNELVSRIVMVVNIMTPENIEYVIGNIHFTWSPNGISTIKQKDHLSKLLNTLDNFHSIILCGDFNAPRGGEIFDTLATRYKDNIPLYYKKSLDEKFHRSGNINLMVDGLFSSKKYKVTNVKLVPGLSDHYGIVATLSQ